MREEFSQGAINAWPIGIYSAGGGHVLEEFWAAPPVPAARISAFFDVVSVLLCPELALDIAAIVRVVRPRGGSGAAAEGEHDETLKQVEGGSGGPHS